MYPNNPQFWHYPLCHNFWGNYCGACSNVKLLFCLFYSLVFSPCAPENEISTTIPNGAQLLSSLLSPCFGGIPCFFWGSHASGQPLCQLGYLLWLLCIPVSQLPDFQSLTSFGTWLFSLLFLWWWWTKWSQLWVSIWIRTQGNVYRCFWSICIFWFCW